ncbi:MAG TPA: TonB-dependent receptor [Candidatus Elarobacter sp.]|nr:TonB-dependent receptor [Candidatus Elarobacter sp.]
MVTRHLFGARIVALAVMLAFVASLSSAAFAQAATSISGTVTNQGKPVSGATVTLSGVGAVQRTTTSPTGAFRFNALPIGTYTVSVPGGSGTVSTQVDLTSVGASVTLDTAPIQQIGHVAVVSTRAAHASGTDVVVTGNQLERGPTANSLPDILAQLPTAARGTNGQIHINGDHNGINYLVDGIQIPQGLNRVLGNEIDPANIGFAEVLEGAYPAQYGDKFGAVVNISSRSKTGPAGANLDLRGGSYGLADSLLSAHSPVGDSGSLYVGARFFHDGRALDPAVPNPVHDAGSTVSQFMRLSLPMHGSDSLTLDLSHSLSTFQVPPDLANGVPANTDDNEYQNDTNASLIYRHAIGDRGVLSFGPSFKRSRILDTNDLANDLAVGAGTTCTDFSDCSGFSVFADRTAIDYRMNGDFVYRMGNHELHAGAIYGVETITKNYAITLQAGNALSPTGDPFTVVDNEPNIAHTEEFFVQDGWQMNPLWRLDYGARADAFQIFSNDFRNGFFQVSPRVKLTRTISPRASVYAYYGRLFVPFSFENVAPSAAAALYAPGTADTNGNDLRPQRDSLYELGGHLPLGRGDLGIRLSHKVSTDWIDDTQVGATNLHQDINFPIGRVDSQTLAYTLPLARAGRFYFNVAHTMAVNSTNCETQLLQNCLLNGPPGGDLVQADHDQHYDVTSGVLTNDTHGGWFSLEGEYGSGLSQDPSLCPPFPLGNAINCKVPPHITIDVAKGFAVGKNAQFALAVRNLFDDRYAITLNNSLQGTHYARPRTIEARLMLGPTR